ncbi:GntR family transcriptional regulator [Erysipelatoclostridium sp. An173]|uniref:GntR family transcriptional regulator n=1 Tax=Erysipelatoclostridium sp. An173 TaxID=1965571 RepID=UPI000B3A7435|nr:GntR family transcriptional regulator [Erysipelatoclostridium sp. An173]OUP76182.1 GntR family transcriptional regulator [Erysipelatoclostridium sp. An173]
MIIELNYTSDTPIYLQLRNEIVKGIASGQFKYGEALPTVRTLAKELQVNNMTVNKAYSLLKQEGYICIDRRHGAKVQPTIDNSYEHQEKLVNELELLASEAIVKGMDKEDFIDTCKKLLQSINYDPSIAK